MDPAPGDGMLTRAPAARPLAQEAVRVASLQGLAVPLQLAVARGYFHEQGIELQLQEFGSGAEAAVALSTGAVDAGSITPTASLFNALGRGLRLHLALAGSEVTPGAGSFPLLARQDPEGPVFRQIPELRGRRVGQVQHGSILDWALDRALADADLQPDDVETVLLPFPDILAAFGSGALDAAFVPEPWATLAVDRGLALPVAEAATYVPGAQLAVMSFSERFAQERVPVAERWAVAYLRSVRDFMDAVELGHDRERVIQLAAEASGFEPRLLNRVSFLRIRRDGRVNVAAILALLDWAMQRGFVAQRPEILPLLDTHFADYASKTLDGRP